MTLTDVDRELPNGFHDAYLLRFATERTLTINTAAIGGNVELLS